MFISVQYFANPKVYLKNTFILVCFISMQFCGMVFGQSQRGKIIDKGTKLDIPLVQLTNLQSDKKLLTDLGGNFSSELNETFKVIHPLYEPEIVQVEKYDSIFIIELTPKTEIKVSSEQLEKGKNILENHHRYLPQTSTNYQPSFEFLSFTEIEILGQSKNNPDIWTPLNSFQSIEKNRFKYPDKKYARVVRSKFGDGDSSKLGFVPLNAYTISNQNEYVDLLNLKFYNPLYKDAHKRYDYALLDSIQLHEGYIQILYVKPKPNRRFIGFTGLLYFTGDLSSNWGGYLLPGKKNIQEFTLSYYQALTSKNTRFVHDFLAVLRLKRIPYYHKLTTVKYTSKNSLPNFDLNDSSKQKWINMALFDHEKDTVEDDTWRMTQIVDKDKLQYIEKDTVDKKFLLSNTLKQMYNIYDGKVGYRMKFFDLNNVFAINKFEAVRIGIGLQSHEHLSEAFTFGGYIGYGIGDGRFKYGGNVGVYFGAHRRNLLSGRIIRDLLEPGVVNYLDKRQDIVRDFFTSRMDSYQSGQISLHTRVNPYIRTELLFNNYSLKPLYDYKYNPYDDDLSEIQTFPFTETSLLINVGTPFTSNPYLRELLFKDKRIKSNLFLNATKGWDIEKGGAFDYWKLNGRLNSTVQLTRLTDLDIVLDAGVMTKDLPYPIMYGGPGTEFKFTGIIIDNAFQTMKLYGFFTDVYAHSFINYNLGNVIFKKTKFKPELALAFNLGWGKIRGSKEIHDLIVVQDYPRGYYEAGVLLNNLLRLKFYKYFYGGLGIGTFVGFGPYTEDGAFAIRISYELGVL